jgi:hypothetical protein
MRTKTNITNRHWGSPEDVQKFSCFDLKKVKRLVEVSAGGGYEAGRRPGIEASKRKASGQSFRF